MLENFQALSLLNIRKITLFLVAWGSHRASGQYSVPFRSAVAKPDRPLSLAAAACRQVVSLHQARRPVA